MRIAFLFVVLTLVFPLRAFASLCHLVEQGVALDIPLSKVRHYDLAAEVSELMRPDYADARKLASEIFKKNGYLNPNSLRIILEFAMENAAGHGAIGSQSTVKYGTQADNEGTHIYILNRANRDLPPTLRGKTFRGNEPPTAVPSSERDTERGGFGMGVERTTSALRHLYLKDLQTEKIAEVTWREVEDPADPRSPKKILFDLYIPRPSAEEVLRLSRVQAEKVEKERREKIEEKKVYAAAKLLEATTSFDPGKRALAKERVVQYLKDGLESDVWPPMGFPAIHALSVSGTFARDAEPLLWSYFDRIPKKDELSSFDSAATAIGAVSDFGPDTIAKIKARLERATESGDIGRCYSLAEICRIAGRKAAPLKELLLKPVELGWESSGYFVLPALQRITLDESDVPQIRRIFQIELQKDKPDFYYPAEIAKHLGPQLPALRPVLIEALAKENAYAVTELLVTAGLTKADLPALLEHVKKEPQKQNDLKYPIRVIASMGPLAADAKPRLFELLLNPHTSYSASVALKKIGLTSQDRRALDETLKSAKGNHDLTYRIEGLLKELK